MHGVDFGRVKRLISCGKKMIAKNLTKVNTIQREEVCFCMPAQWTGVLVGKLHNAGILRKELAAHMNLNEKYVSSILNGHDEPSGAEARFNAALDELIAEKTTQLSEQK